MSTLARVVRQVGVGKFSDTFPHSLGIMWLPIPFHFHPQL